MNRSLLDFGCMQTGQRVHHVALPKWAKNNPYIFVVTMRKALESDIVSTSINHWIDLIFGYKQKGEEAIKAINTFYHLTYDDCLNTMDENMDEATQRATQSQIFHFGQCPSQIFKSKPHPRRVR